MSECVVQVMKRRKSDGLLTGQPLTYRYDSPLRVGDQVMCPATEFSGGPWLAQVTQLGSDYQGYTKTLLCRVAPDRKR